MKKLIYVCVALAAMSVATSSYAQGFSFKQSVSLVTMIPTGDFGKSVDLLTYYNGTTTETYPVLGRDNVGKDAGLGLGLNYRAMMDFEVMMGNLSPFIEAGFMWNRISRDNRDKFDEARSTTPKYYNVPIMIGLQYSYDLHSNVKPYGEFAIGTDLFFITREGKKDDAVVPNFVYKTGAALAWQIGVGAYIGNRVSAGITYYGYGKHSVDYNESRTSFAGSTIANYAYVENASHTVFRRIGCIALKVGFHF